MVEKTIPDCCPSCKEKDEWAEVIKPFTTGIPVGKSTRISFLSVRGLFAKPLKKKLGLYTVTYRCGKCGFEDKYDNQLN